MSSVPAPIRIALVEDEASTRHALEQAIAQDPGLQLLHAADTAAGLLAWLAANPVDVLLVDLGLPDQPGLEVIRRCRALQPDCEIMVITMFGDEANILAAIENGARGYLLKGGSARDLAADVHALRGGGSPMTPLIARQLLERWAGGRHDTAAQVDMPTASATATAGNTLTAREREVLDLVARGFTYGEIARHLGVGLSTVHTHVRGIYAKLDVHNKTEAVYEARQLGWLPP